MKHLTIPLLLALLVLPRTTAWAEDPLDALLDEWQIVNRRVDARGVEEQRVVLDRIAELRTEPAREALARLLQGTHARPQAGLLLAALVRYATPAWIDRVIAWVEADKHGVLRDGLGEALGEVAEPETQAYLRGAALRRAVPAVRAEIAEGLGRMRNRAAVPALLLLLKQKDLDVRCAALEALGTIGDGMAAGPVAVFLSEPDWRVRASAARALGEIDRDRAARALEEALDDEHPRVAEASARALGRIGARGAIPALIATLAKVGETDLRVADACVEALQSMSGKAFGVDPAGWRDWWESVEGTAWERIEHPPGGYTVPAQRYYGFAIRSSKLVFVLDVSRSMGWNGRLEVAKKELVRALEDLPPTTLINIITYSDRAKAWGAKLRPATPTLVRRAVAFVKGQRPDNGTNTWEALQKALGNGDVDTVFFLSDGHPSVDPRVGGIVDPERILAAVRDANRHRRVRIHCVALVRGEPPTGFAGREDRARAIRFMRRLAADTNGKFELVE